MSDEDYTEEYYETKKTGFFQKVLLFLLGMFFLGVVVLLVGYLWILDGLPTLVSIKDYKPSIATRVLSKDGRLLGEFYKERRYVVDVNSFPKSIVNAFLAAEDESFFEHSGINPKSIIRAISS